MPSSPTSVVDIAPCSFHSLAMYQPVNHRGRDLNRRRAATAAYSLSPPLFRSSDFSFFDLLLRLAGMATGVAVAIVGHPPLLPLR